MAAVDAGGSWVIDMAEYIILMHDDALGDEKAWGFVRPTIEAEWMLSSR
jgi:hypothetical protein